MAQNANYWIENLRLGPHPEGGYFCEVYRSEERVPSAALPIRYGSNRCFGTSIYYMLVAGEFSAFHRLDSDEIWHFYAGEMIDLHMIHSDGRHEHIKVGNKIDQGQQLQVAIPRQTWFAASVASEYALVGCTVSPGFEYDDFEMGKREELLDKFPQHAKLIEKYVRN